jgi:membrane protein YdbS with pleckstrin-like domain
VRVGSVGTVLVVVWLLIGVLAAGQRGYFSGSDANCAKAGTIIVTMLVGPLNYLGVNPKIKCTVPRPSP